jgi:hypothetical protein
MTINSYPLKRPIIFDVIFLGTCEYMGKQYTTGQRWDDGCRYHCQCIDGMSGQYKCDERLVKYHNT